MPDEYLSVAQVADLLGVSRDTVRKDIAEGRLPALELGPRRIKRVKREDLEALAVRPSAPVTPLRG